MDVTTHRLNHPTRSQMTGHRPHRRGTNPAPTTRHEPEDGPEEAPTEESSTEDEEDYVALAIGRLQQARWATRIAATALQQAQDDESAVWGEFEGYLLEAARWHHRQTGSRRLESDNGVLVLQEIPERALVAQPETLAAWMRKHQAAIESLARALAASPSTSSSALPGASPLPPAPDPAAPQATEAALLGFYRQTGLLPDGCRIEPARSVLTLE